MTDHWQCGLVRLVVGYYSYSGECVLRNSFKTVLTLSTHFSSDFDTINWLGEYFIMACTLIMICYTRNNYINEINSALQFLISIRRKTMCTIIIKELVYTDFNLIRTKI